GTRKATKKKSKREEKAEELEDALLRAQQRIAIPAAAQTFGRAAAWRQYFAATKRECLSVFKSIPFLIMVALGVANVWGSAVTTNPIFGTNFYPVTKEMIETIAGAFGIFALLIAAFYAGDIV